MIKIPPFRLVKQPLDDDAANMPSFKWAGGDIGERSKLGGSPDFLQQEDIPPCPDCRRQMTFYAQLDSINDDVILGDCGMIYVFVCFGCLETKAVLQSF